MIHGMLMQLVTSSVPVLLVNDLQCNVRLKQEGK